MDFIKWQIYLRYIVIFPSHRPGVPSASQFHVRHAMTSFIFDYTHTYMSADGMYAGYIGWLVTRALLRYESFIGSSQVSWLSSRRKHVRDEKRSWEIKCWNSFDPASRIKWRHREIPVLEFLREREERGGEVWRSRPFHLAGNWGGGGNSWRRHLFYPADKPVNDMLRARTHSPAHTARRMHWREISSS